MTRNPLLTTAEQAGWAALLVAVAAISSSVFACVTPFAAFAVAAAYVLPARAAAATAAGVWLANQAVGFGYLHYPWDGNTILWGLAIGAATVLATLSAARVLHHMRQARIAATGTALLVAFAAYEGALFLVALVLGAEDGFALATVGRLALLNLAWTAGLVAFEDVTQRFGTIRLITGRHHRRTA